MAEYCDLLGTSTGVGTAFAAMTGSPYGPKKSGRLKKIIVTLSRTANTSIAWAGEIRLSCATFGGVNVQVPFNGIGEAAADIVEAAGGQTIIDLGLGVSIMTGVPITVEYRYSVTPTTPDLLVHGIFEG